MPRPLTALHSQILQLASCRGSVNDPLNIYNGENDNKVPCPEKGDVHM